jgi:hypothetical protein
MGLCGNQAYLARIAVKSVSIRLMVLDVSFPSLVCLTDNTPLQSYQYHLSYDFFLSFASSRV